MNEKPVRYDIGWSRMQEEFRQAVFSLGGPLFLGADLQRLVVSRQPDGCPPMTEHLQPFTGSRPAGHALPRAIIPMTASWRCLIIIIRQAGQWDGVAGFRFALRALHSLLPLSCCRDDLANLAVVLPRHQQSKRSCPRMLRISCEPQPPY
ncbi:hypothetical protein BO78DRAFT_214059 [Aspergillus sclerotiicarbonarius CBS 121057]|uniref:Uncharacterized protein n=1 Tax=Aspergillus sclerotiicarbonarius (strain CBS 121057 / IBT 28362) TaxID=1448318 RepID=A0A319DZZ6_ASPSB|nr:hypothetical protein BO78DRAFT_214059 [Aspergillus sclerotiicarbonarius CBS 121057]